MSIYTYTITKSDYEWFDVLFEDGKAMSVTRSRVEWNGEQKPTPQIKKIIETAEREIWGNR